jgi:hypothetical protein
MHLPLVEVHPQRYDWCSNTAQHAHLHKALCTGSLLREASSGPKNQSPRDQFKIGGIIAVMVAIFYSIRQYMGVADGYMIRGNRLLKEN